MPAEGPASGWDWSRRVAKIEDEKMARAPKNKDTDTAIQVIEIKQQLSRFNILGTTPLLMHRFDQKAQLELLFPSGRKTTADKATSLKHDPIAEFRAAAYINLNPGAAYLHLPAGMFKAAMADAALRIPGVSKTEIQQLVQVTSVNVDLFGDPRLHMCMARMADMNRTPDVRTRPIFEEWACSVDVQYPSSRISASSIANLLAAAGLVMGVGDWRPQKGGSYGQFRLVSDADADFRRIVKTQGAASQREGLAAAVPYDSASEELLALYMERAETRELGHTRPELAQAAE